MVRLRILRGGHPAATAAGAGFAPLRSVSLAPSRQFYSWVCGTMLTRPFLNRGQMGTRLQPWL